MANEFSKQLKNNSQRWKTIRTTPVTHTCIIFGNCREVASTVASHFAHYQIVWTLFVPVIMTRTRVQTIFLLSYFLNEPVLEFQLP